MFFFVSQVFFIDVTRCDSYATRARIDIANRPVVPESKPPCLPVSLRSTRRGEDTKRNLKHAKRLRRSYVPGCGAAEIDLDRGSAMFPSGNRR